MNFSKLIQKENILVHGFTVGIATFFYLYSRETAGLKYYLKYIQKYNESGEPVTIRNILKFRFSSVLEDFRISEWNRKYYDVFITKELDPVFCGSTKSRYGIKIGIPEYYQHGTEEGIMNTKILIDNKPVKWDSSEGEKFLKSLFLGQNAQKFAIAKAVALCDNYYFILKSFIPILVFAGFYSGMSRASDKFKLRHRHRALTVMLYMCGVIFSTSAFLFLKDGLYLQYENVAEDKVYGLGESYILGGIEYYTKRIERNKALRNLAKNGHRHYTVGGNETSFLTSKGWPDTVKLRLAVQRSEKYSIDKEVMTPPPVNPNPHPVL